MVKGKNVLGGDLQTCSRNPLTGFYRDGCCNTGFDDTGIHVICARMTQEFLEFSRLHGNDLISPAPQYGFPGLKPGDRWCLGAARWKEACQAGVAPPVILAATNVAVLEIVPLDVLKAHALDLH